MEIKDYIEKLQKRKKENVTQTQYTRHQQDALDTAKLFNDMKSLGIYMRLFKKYRREALLKCRDWVEEKCRGNKGRIFVKVYKKFLDN